MPLFFDEALKLVNAASPPDDRYVVPPDLQQRKPWRNAIRDFIRTDKVFVQKSEEMVPVLQALLPANPVVYGPLGCTELTAVRKGEDHTIELEFKSWQPVRMRTLFLSFERAGYATWNIFLFLQLHSAPPQWLDVGAAKPSDRPALLITSPYSAYHRWPLMAPNYPGEAGLDATRQVFRYMVHRLEPLVTDEDMMWA